MSKTTSEKGRQFIARHEGEKLTVYRDVAGFLTVGVGHLVLPNDKLRYGDSITAEQSDAFLQADLRSAEDAVNQLVRVPLSQNEFDALVSLFFNLGRKNLANSRTLRFLNNGDKQRFGDALLQWNKATIKGRLQAVKGLTIRRLAEQKLFLEGKYK